jgi:hypothetical protein
MKMPIEVGQDGRHGGGHDQRIQGPEEQSQQGRPHDGKPRTSADEVVSSAGVLQ